MFLCASSVVRTDGDGAAGVRGLAKLAEREVAAPHFDNIPARRAGPVVYRQGGRVGTGFADTLVLLGVASLSTIVPSGPAFIGTLQFAYALAIEFAGAPPAVGVAAATLAQVCILLPTALAAVAVLVHRSGGALSRVLAKREPKLTPVSP